MKANKTHSCLLKTILFLKYSKILKEKPERWGYKCRSSLNGKNIRQFNQVESDLY